jgi:integrase
VAIFPQHTSRNGDPQLHVHVLWLNKVEALRDGRWRAIDSRGLYRNKGAGSALAAFALETGLTRRFGLEWAYRPASKGRVIAGFPEKAIAQFSSRRAQITKATLALAEEYEKDRGHAPDQRALASMRQFANAMTRRAKGQGALDFAVLLREWEQASRDAELGALRDLARTVWHVAPGANARTGARGDARAELARMAAQLTLRGDLTHARRRGHGGRPRAGAGVTRRVDPRGSCSLHRPEPARPRDRPGPGARLAAPRRAHRPGDRRGRWGGGVSAGRSRMAAHSDSLCRANGESIYRAHGCELYATRAQLSLEQQLLADAQAESAPHLARDQAAALLGADLAQLETQVHAGTPAANGVTQGGLRLDQASAAFLALTSPRRAELIVGPAGTGKTYTAVRIANVWRTAGKGQVFGIAATSAGRNVLVEAGIPVAENTAQFLGHLPGQREARGATSLGPDALVILDEASTTTMPDLAAIIRHTTRSGAKLVITGDHAQLGAVQSGGGMAMLARKLGYAQLTEAPQLDEKEVEPYGIDEIQRLVDVASGRRNSARWALALALGLRQGEALGLRWEDVDLDHGVLHVRRSRLRPKYAHGCGDSCGRTLGTCPQRVSTRPATGRVKSKAGRRTIGLPPQLVALLRAHWAEQERECKQARQRWQEEGWVFASPTGQPLNPNSDYHEWKRLLKEAGLREARLHDARHTAATVLLLLDVPERTVMSLMGWSSTDMAARYQHVTDTIRQDVARQVDVLIWQARDSSTGEGTVPVSRVCLTAILRLAELGLVHADEAVMADAQEAIEQIRAVLADGVGHSAPDTDEPGPRGTSTEGGETK